ncbi:recombination protein RecR [Candidatus Gottesmanbacteria bacterium RIFCSPHIGHO2_02_FULL_39_11]|uniref:Recombination protein RecR n=1 Tax=Candidatus Gottesmanbacteria bacterium RIFCSPHIGHO2_02_FULL_39_11 TaxID=1798382 RepID=A0A1F5ZW60_9BACT|nr:MAG: recombination protein RecR [Candidatus Gottesmanbacteria bacterium RIFCSPHIGHO2_02_FULL_39_11]
MKILPRSVEKLMESFQKLPGVGPKSASRLTFYLLHVPQTQLDEFSESLKNLKTSTVYCSICSNIGESDPCVICAEPERDHSIVCVVEEPIEILSVERTGKYKGVYHVLHGAIDPLNNIGPDEIKIKELIDRLEKDEIKEIILATNPTMEGEATAMYIRREIQKLKSQIPNLDGIKITRLAHGLPVGGDLEYADEVTLGRAMEGRVNY